MRYSILQLLAILGLGVCTACSSDLDSGSSKKILPNSRVMEFSYKLPVDETIQSRATEPGTDSENEIQTFQAFIFDENQELISQFRVGEGLQTPDKSKVRLFIADSEADKFENRALRVVLVANYSVDSEINSFLNLQNHLLTTNFNEDNPSTFVMTGSLVLNQIKWLEDNPVFEVEDDLELVRVASKFQFEIRNIEVYDETNNTKVHYELVGTPKVRFINYSTHSSLLPGLLRDSVLSSTDYLEMVSLDAGYTLPQAYYSYESAWSADQDFDSNREPHLMLKLEFKAKNSSGVYGEEKEYFYYVPINYRFPTVEMSPEEAASLYKIQRNHLYRIISSIHHLGAEDEGEPFDLSSEIRVGPWVDREIDGDIDVIHFLMVKDRKPAMPNINQIRIDYQSSLPIEFVHIKTEYTEHIASGEIRIVTNTRPDKLIITDVDSLNYIDIVNPIPENFVPLDIFFTVRHKYGSNLSQDIHIIQYPPKYVTGTKSTGFINSTATNPYADFRFHNLLGMVSSQGAGGLKQIMSFIKLQHW